jgi:hypothetical protein
LVLVHQELTLLGNHYQVILVQTHLSLASLQLVVVAEVAVVMVILVVQEVLAVADQIMDLEIL